MLQGTHDVCTLFSRVFRDVYEGKYTG